MSLYARDTVVSVEKSRAEIETILARYGASAFAYSTGKNQKTGIDQAMIMFQADDDSYKSFSCSPAKP